MEKVADARIDVKEKLMVFEVKDLYYLEVNLPYDVLEEES